MQRSYCFSFPFLKTVLVILGCFSLFVRCTPLEKAARATGMATDVAHRPVDNFIKQSRPKNLDYRPLYVDEERRSRGSNTTPSENAETFKDLEQDLNQQLEKVQNLSAMPH